LGKNYPFILFEPRLGGSFTLLKAKKTPLKAAFSVMLFS